MIKCGGMIATICEDPKCGFHFVLLDENMVMVATFQLDRPASLDMVKHLQSLLYHKAVSDE